MPNETPLPQADHHPDDPFQMFIQRDLDLDGLTDEDDWDDLDDDPEDDDAEGNPSPLSRRFGSSFAHPPVVLPLLTDPRWRHGLLTLTEPVTVHRYPRIFSEVLCYLQPTSQPPRDSILYLPDVQPGWTAIHLAVGPGFVRSSDFPIAPRRRWRWPRYWLVIVLAALVVAFGLEQERTRNSLNTTLAAQQTQLNDLHATLAASSQ